MTRLTRKFAHTQDSLRIGGDLEKRSRLEITILMARALAAQGKPTAVRLVAQLRAGIAQPEPAEGTGFLVVPEELTMEELIAEIEGQNKNAVEPGTAINLQAEEFQKAARGEPSEYGDALLAFHRKYHG